MTKFIDYRDMKVRASSLIGPTPINRHPYDFQIDSYQISIWRDNSALFKKWYIAFPEVTQGHGMIGPFWFLWGARKFAKSLVVQHFIDEQEREI